MGSSKIKNICFLVGLTVSTSLFAQSFEEYKKAQTQEYKKYKANIEAEFKAYKKAYEEAFEEFSKELSNTWPEKKPVLSTKNKWVEYSDDLSQRKTVDFEKKNIKLEVVAKDEKDALRKFNKMYDDIMKKDVKTAVKDDKLEQKIRKKLKKKPVPVPSQQKIISDILTQQQKWALKKDIKKKNFVVVKHKDKFIYKTNVKLPSNTTLKKAQKFKSDVIKNANKQKIPAALIYAIMQSESSFNPMARSYIPAFGLMQIVPKTAGVDSYKFLYGKKRLLSSSYLYNSQKNINIGSAYLHILYYKYLRKVKDPQSRLYCAIAAYNTGAGNVAKAFIGSYNINKAATKINSMSSDDVYKTLMKKLPYNETKKYLKKVTYRMSVYNKLLVSNRF